MATTKCQDIEQRFAEFGQRRHWRIELDGAPYEAVRAYRKFEFGCGARAWLYVQHALNFRHLCSCSVQWPLDRRRRWEAGLGIPFAVGPQAGHEANDLDHVLEWATNAESVLQAALGLEWSGPAEARAKLKNIDRLKGWYLISVVFDLDPMCATIAEKLLRRQAPHLAGQDVRR